MPPLMKIDASSGRANRRRITGSPLRQQVKLASNVPKATRSYPPMGLSSVRTRKPHIPLSNGIGPRQLEPALGGDLPQPVRVVGDDAVHPVVDQLVHGRLVVDGPRDHL